MSTPQQQPQPQPALPHRPQDPPRKTAPVSSAPRHVTSAGVPISLQEHAALGRTSMPDGVRTAQANEKQFLFRPEVWGPHYWFFLHTAALTYPEHPNEETKKIYYQLITHFPKFIPIENVSAQFAKLLHMYPVSAYLDNRASLVRWVNFIHNQVNIILKKPLISLDQFYVDYYASYRPVDLKLREKIKWREQVMYTLLIAGLGCAITYLQLRHLHSS